jgi:hypothetical protein
MSRYVSSCRRQRASNAPTKARISCNIRHQLRRERARAAVDGDADEQRRRLRQPAEATGAARAHPRVPVGGGGRGGETAGCSKAARGPRGSVAAAVGAPRRRERSYLARMRRTPMSSARGGSRGGWSSSPAPSAPRAPSPTAPTSARLLDRARTRLTQQRVPNVSTPVPGARDSETRQRCGLHSELHPSMLSIDIVALIRVAMVLRMFCTPPSTS